MSRSRDRLEKLLAEAPELPEEEVIAELRSLRIITAKDLKKLKAEGSALSAFSNDLAKERHLGNLCKHNRLRMPKAIGVQLISNQFKWLNTGILQDLERIDTVLGRG